MMINGNRILVKDSYSLPTSVPELSEENVGAEIFSLIIDISYYSRRCGNK